MTSPQALPSPDSDEILQNVSEVPVLLIRLIDTKEILVVIPVNLADFVGVSCGALLLVSFVILTSQVQPQNNHKCNSNSKAGDDGRIGGLIKSVSILSAFQYKRLNLHNNWEFRCYQGANKELWDT